jgi:hypothetical protein
MKRIRNLIILLAVAAALVVAIVVVLPAVKPKEAEPSPAAPTMDPAKLKICDYASDKVTEVTIENEKTKFKLVRSDDKFVVEGQEGLELDKTAASTIISAVANLTAEDLIAENPADLDQYGLKKPQAKATAKYADGTTSVYLLGDELVTGSTYYFMKEGDPRVFSVWQNIGSAYLGTVDSLLVKGKFTLEQADIDYVKTVKNGAVVVEMTSKGAYSSVGIAPWTIEQPFQRFVSSSQLSTYLQSILSVTMGDIVEGDANDLVQYGLDKPIYDITISGKDAASGDEITNELLIGADKDENYAYAKFADRSTVYLVSKSALSFADTGAAKLMDKTIILVNITSVLKVDFDGLDTHGTMIVTQTPSKDDKGEIRKDSNGKTLYDQTFSIDDKSIEDGIARYFYQECIGLATHSMVANGWQPTGEAPVATLTYTRNADPREIKIEFLPYDKDFYAVRMNGQTAFLIEQGKVKALADKVAQLKAGTLVKPAS